MHSPSSANARASPRLGLSSTRRTVYVASQRASPVAAARASIPVTPSSTQRDILLNSIAAAAAAEARLQQREDDVARLVDLNDELAERLAEVTARTAAMPDAGARIETLERSLAAAQGRCAALADELETVKAARRGAACSCGVTSSGGSRRDGRRTMDELVAALAAAEGEVSAQVHARLELEARLRVLTDELRVALRAVSTAREQRAAAEAEAQRSSGAVASLTARLDALRSRNEVLERSVAARVAVRLPPSSSARRDKSGDSPGDAARASVLQQELERERVEHERQMLDVSHLVESVTREHAAVRDTVRALAYENAAFRAAAAAGSAASVMRADQRSPRRSVSPATGRLHASSHDGSHDNRASDYGLQRDVPHDAVPNRNGVLDSDAHESHAGTADTATARSTTPGSAGTPSHDEPPGSALASGTEGAGALFPDGGSVSPVAARGRSAVEGTAAPPTPLSLAVPPAAAVVTPGIGMTFDGQGLDVATAEADGLRGATDASGLPIDAGAVVVSILRAAADRGMLHRDGDLAGADGTIPATSAMAAAIEYLRGMQSTGHHLG